MSGIGIYIHYPFCISKCPYCDFNAHTERSISDQQWLAGILKDLDHQITFLSDSQACIQSIFLGGGTPSLLSPDLIAQCLKEIHQRLPIKADVEISLEANPNSYERHKFRDFRHAGINRLSLGIQSLLNDDLKFLGRSHNSEQAWEAINEAQEHFDNFSLDLIYGRPQQTWSNWEQELSQIIKLNPPHLSLYMLTIEDGTIMARDYRQGLFDLPTDELSADLYERNHKYMENHGYTQYEISNFARPDFICHHNSLYWSYQSYLGLGPGAHSRIIDSHKKVRASRCHNIPHLWYDLTQNQGHGWKESEILPPKQAWEEALMMGLRHKLGINLAYLYELGGDSVAMYLSHNKIQQLTDAGYINLNQGQISPSFQGFCLSSSIYSFLKS